MLGNLRIKLIDVLRGTSVIRRLRFLELVEREAPSTIDDRMNSTLESYLKKVVVESSIDKALEFKDFPVINKGFANRNRAGLENKSYNRLTFKKSGWTPPNLAHIERHMRRR